MRKTSNSFSKQNSQQPKVFRGGEKKVMKKSLLSLALAGSMLSALAVPAFAATPSDVVGKPVQSAVEQLTALGIVQGYADGTFKPDNTITRAELAKIVIVATGNESSANLMANTAPAFKDVKKGAWYTGYINAAAAKGFIQGYNGNFRPNDTIKFEEVVAILVRALGYQDKYLSGSWPYNVLLQADEVGLFEGVDAANGTNATRGVVAELTSNTLDKQLVSYNADGDLGYLLVDTDGDGKGDAAKLFISKLGAFEPANVLTAGALNSSGQISLGGKSVATAKEFFVTGGKKLSELLGHTVSVLKNKNGEVIAVTDAQESAKIVNASTDVDTITLGSTTPAVPADLTFKVNNGAASYTATADVKVFVNSVEQALPYTFTNDQDVQLLLNSKGNVQAILVSTWKSNNVFKEVVSYSTYSRIIGKDGYSVKVDANTAITLDGKAAALADLKENDVVNFVVNGDGLALQVVATRNVVTGKLQAVGRDNDNNPTYTVNGTTYSQVGAQISALTASNIGTEYAFNLNKDGKVVFYSSTAAVAASNFAVILDVDNTTKYSIIDNGMVSDKVYNKVVYYSLKDNTKVTAYTKDGDYAKNTLVPLKTDSDGRLTLVSAADKAADNTLTVDTVTSLTGAAVTAVDSSKVTAGTTYRLDSSTVYLKFGVNTGTPSDSTVAAGTAADVTKGASIAVRSNDTGVAQYVIVLGSGSVDQLAQAQGLFISKSYTATTTNAADNVYTINLKVNGETKSFNVDATTYGATYAANDLVTLTDAATGAGAGDGKYDAKAIVNTPATGVAITDISGKKFTVAGHANPFVATAATQVYIKKTDGTIEVSNFTDVLVAADNYGTAPGKYEVTVTGTGTSYNGNDEAGVILITAH
ncbi:S-layer homology domain-containing protein [Paenibacillus sp. JDR-2]|uniref:S-layer homology domain-containing protein n=1 Tax=Paenibacillus sp. (strain JDR-2) TaxID=324057 RepID=UPI00059FF94A|nr:S-layer homology domain-containing protein [Paenibacillus sp. JDR-2]